MKDQQMSNTILQSIRTLFNFRIKPKQLNDVLTWQLTLLWTRRMQTVCLVRAPLEGRWSSGNRVCLCMWACLCVCKYGFGPPGASRGSLRVHWHLSVLTLSNHSQPGPPFTSTLTCHVCKKPTPSLRVTFPIIPSGCVCVCRLTERLTVCGISWGQTSRFRSWPFTFRCRFCLEKNMDEIFMYLFKIRNRNLDQA